MLKKFVLAVESGIYSSQGIDIWAAIPGGVIFGRIVSLEELEKHLEGHMPSESLGDKRNMEIQAKEMLDKVDQIRQPDEEADENIASLVNVTIVSGTRSLKMPMAELRIDSVAAWGLGTLSSPTNEG